MEQNKEREAFEAAWKERYSAHGRSAFLRSEIVPGGYANTRVNDAWAMWQARANQSGAAAEMARAKALNEAAELCEDEYRIRTQAGNANPVNSASRDRCFAAARAAANCVAGIRGLIETPAVASQSAEPVALMNQQSAQVVVSRFVTEETHAYLDKLRFAASEAIRTFEDAGDAMSWSPTIDAIERLKGLLGDEYPYHSDDAAVDAFAWAMRDKMEESREKGRSGWDKPFECSPYRLAEMLIEHVAKGDPVDVGNFAMMLFNRPDARGVLAKVWKSRYAATGAQGHLSPDVSDAIAGHIMAELEDRKGILDDVGCDIRQEIREAIASIIHRTVLAQSAPAATAPSDGATVPPPVQVDTAPMYKALIESRLALLAANSAAAQKAIILIDAVINAAPAPSASPELPGWRFRNRDGGVWVVKPPAGDEWAVFQNTPAYALIEAIHAAKPSASPAVLTDEQIMKCLVEVRWSNNDAWCIDRIRHLLAASPADQGWQPIETAPKDGTEILLTNGKTVAEGQWCDEEPSIREYRDADGRWIDQQESDGFEGWMDWSGGMKPDPTHWMPLPTVPAMSATPPAGER